MTSVDTITQRREDCSSASVVNHTIVTDPTIWQPGFDLPRHTWSLINRFRTGEGPCRAKLHKWGLAQSPSCDCQRQTINQTADTCPLTKSEGGLKLLHEAYDDAVMWLESTATAALTHAINNKSPRLLWASCADSTSPIKLEVHDVKQHCQGKTKPLPSCGSCLCHEHITNLVIGVSRPPVLDCGTTFHLDYGGRDLPSTPSDNL